MREWLQTARREKGMTKRQVANAIGITESYYGFIEKGVRQKKMDITLVAKIADVLGLNVTDIISFESK